MPVRDKLSVTLTAAAAGDYAAGDVVSDSATNDAGTALEIAGRDSGTIVGVSAVCSEDTVTFRLRLHIFDEEPLAAEVEMDDNAAFDIKTSAGAAKYTGTYVDLPAMADRGTAAASAANMDARIPFKVARGISPQAFYVVVETLDAETNEAAGMDIRFDFYIL